MATFHVKEPVVSGRPLDSADDGFVPTPTRPWFDAPPKVPSAPPSTAALPGDPGLTTGRTISTPTPPSEHVHKHAAAGGWARLDLVEQLANVGSEVERTIRAHRAGRASRFESALERALELFDLTAADPRWRGHRCQEVLRAREEFCRLFFDPDVPADSAEGLRRYFFGFAHAARMRHYRRLSDGA